MKNKIAIVIILFIGFLGGPKVKAQDVVVYDTFEDFLSHKGKEYNEFITSWKSTFGGKMTIVVKHKGEKLKVDASEKWGFTCKNTLFRIGEHGKYPFRVMAIGDDFCYYERGFDHLNAIRDKTENVSFTVDGSPISFVSKALTSDLIPIFSNSSGNPVINKKGIRDLKKHLSEPEYAPFFECLSGNIEITKLRTCAEAFTDDGFGSSNKGEPKKSAVEYKNDKINNEEAIYFTSTRKSTSTGSSSLKMSFTKGIGGTDIKLEKFGVNLKPYLKDDKKALEYFKKGEDAWKKFNKYRLVEYGAIGIGLAGIVIAGVGSINKSDSDPTLPPNSVGGLVGTGVGIIIYYFAHFKADKELDKMETNFRKACDTYNENLLAPAAGK